MNVSVGGNATPSATAGLPVVRTGGILIYQYWGSLTSTGCPRALPGVCNLYLEFERQGIVENSNSVPYDAKDFHSILIVPMQKLT